jgi:hypothetical protein
MDKHPSAGHFFVDTLSCMRGRCEDTHITAEKFAVAAAEEMVLIGWIHSKDGWTCPNCQTAEEKQLSKA